MIQFLVELKNEKTRQYDRLAMFMILLNIAVLVLVAFYSSVTSVRTIAFAGAATSALALVVEYILRRKGKATDKIKFLAPALLTITWIFAGYVWGYCLSALLMFLYQVSQRQLVVGIGKEAVSYPSFPKRTIQWQELNNLVLKDGLLTIDFKNDKILQSEIIDSSNLNEKEFNDFCKEQLH